MHLCLCGHINILLEYFRSRFLPKLSRDFKIDYICHECYYFNYISALANVRRSRFGHRKKRENHIDVYEMQIVGDTTVAREALFQVISRLRNNAFRESGSETGRGGGGGRDFGHSMPPLSMSRESYSSSYDFGSRMESRSTRGGVFSLPGMSISGAIHSSSGFGSLASPPEAWGIGVS